MRFLVIARSEATKQSSFAATKLDCFASLAMTVERVQAAAGFGAGREIARMISAATMHSAPAAKNAGR